MPSRVTKMPTHACEHMLGAKMHAQPTIMPSRVNKMPTHACEHMLGAKLCPPWSRKCPPNLL